MKPRMLLVLCSLALIAPVFAQEDPVVPTPLPTPTPVPTPTPTPRPTKVPVKKPEPTPVIDGITIARGSGFLGIAVVEGNFKLSFYDAKKKPVAPDVARAALRWNPNYKVGGERVVLLPSGDGHSLTAGKTIRPPLTFKLFITLVPLDAANSSVGSDDSGSETYEVDFHG